MKNESEILGKALSVLDDALNGRIVDPNSLQTAIQMTQLLWTSVYSDKQREEQIKESLRKKFPDEING